LLLTGSFWSSGKNPKAPGDFLVELAKADIIEELPATSRFEQNPDGDAGPTLSWPADPLGGRRERVEAAAASVRSAQAERGQALADGTGRGAGAWQNELDLLLEERRRLNEAASTVALPQRFSASRF